MPQTTSVAFLFDITRPDHRDPDSVFLCALKEMDDHGITRSLVLRGSLLIRQLCYKPVRVATTPPKNPRQPAATPNSSTLELAGDKNVLATLAGDLSDAISGQWHTFGLIELWSYIANHSLDCIFLPTFPEGFRSGLDRSFRSSSPSYIGAFEVDLGNPLQRNLLAESLYKDAFIANGAVHMSLDYDGSPIGDFDGADDFSAGGIIRLAAGEFDKRSPPLSLPDKLSVRGLISAMRLRSCTTLDVYQRLVNVLSDRPLRPDDPVFDWDVRKLPNAPEEVDVQSKKIAGYLLNPNHDKGRSKAEFFDRDLGISATDATFLQLQLIDALRNAPLLDAKVDAYGIRFNAILPIKGRNDRTATIRTGWIIRPGERASLVTAFPEAKSEPLERQARSLAIIPANIQGMTRWQAIFDLASAAGREAAEQCVPTPMKIAGGELIMDGECGGAYVVVPDARRGFARWLKTTNRGSLDHRSGVRAYAERNDQSADRAAAYAESFAKVLRRHGIEAFVHRYLT